MLTFCIPFWVSPHFLNDSLNICTHWSCVVKFSRFSKCLVSCTIVSYRSVSPWKVPWASPVQHSPFPSSWWPWIFSLSLSFCFSPKNIISLKSYSVFFQIDFLFINVYLSFLYVFLWLDNSFLFIAGEYSMVGIDQSLFIHSPIEGYLGCFQILVMMSKAPLNVCMLFFLWPQFSNLLGE